MLEDSEIADLDKTIYNVTNKPHWKNECEHPDGSYLFSFTPLILGDHIEKLDVYVFDGIRGQEFCLRYGNEGNAYYSPGRIETIIHCERTDEKYEVLLYLLFKYGNLCVDMGAGDKNNGL